MSVAKFLMSSVNANSFAWDLSYANYDASSAFDVSNLTFYRSNNLGGRDGIFFRPTGSTLFGVSTAGGWVSNALSTSWDISGVTNQTSRAFPSARSIFYGDNGNELYVASAFSVLQYYQDAFPYGWTTNFLSSFSVSGEFSELRAVCLKPDGTEMFTVGVDASSDCVAHKYTLSTAWDVTTATSSQNLNISSDFDVVSAVSLSPNGDEMYVVGEQGSSNYLRNYTLSTAWDLSTASLTTSNSLSAVLGSPTAFYLRDDGLRAYVYDDGSSVVREGIMGAFGFLSNEIFPRGISFSANGDKMYICHEHNEYISEYALGVSWDSYSASHTQNLSIAGGGSSGVEFSRDGLNLYTIASGRYVRRYVLSTAWDLSTALYSQSFDAQFQTSTNAVDVRFRVDGLAMYVVDDRGSLHQYSLSSSWDVTTASFVQTLDVSSQQPSPAGLYFKSNGSYLYVCGGDSIDKYVLSTAWDLSTATHEQTLDISDHVENARGLMFKPDGKQLYAVDQLTRSVHQYIFEV